MKRLLLPSTNAAGLSAFAAAVYSTAVMIYHVTQHQAVFSAPVAVSLIGAALALLTRQYVTPVADPKDGNGAPLITAPPAPAAAATVDAAAPGPAVTP